MVDPSDTYPGQRPNPAEILAETVAARQVELNYLVDGLRYGIECIGDLDRVNATILASPRPELTLTEPAPMIQIASPDEFGRLNNFNANIACFGARILSEPFLTRMGVVRQNFMGRRPFTDEEKATAFFMGARGGYEAHHAFAEENGVDQDFATDLLMNTLISDEAFMRMWILFPELTDFIINNSFVPDWKARGLRDTREETFVAYSLMSRLVDMQDEDVIKNDGTVDDYNLCN